MTDEIEQMTTPEYLEYMRSWSKRYLQRVRSCVHTIAMIRSEIEELEANMDGIKAVRYDKENVRSTADDDGMVRLVARMDSLRAEFAEELERNIQAQASAHRALANVRQPWRAVLTYRYVDGKTWADVAEAVKYSEVHCRTELHDNGLIELFPFIPHEYDEFPEAL